MPVTGHREKWGESAGRHAAVIAGTLASVLLDFREFGGDCPAFGIGDFGSLTDADSPRAPSDEASAPRNEADLTGPTQSPGSSVADRRQLVTCRGQFLGEPLFFGDAGFR